jgi:hypothetical protein
MEAKTMTAPMAARGQPGNLFPECGPVIQVLTLIEPAAQLAIAPYLDGKSVVGGGPEWSAGRGCIGPFIGTNRAPDLRALIADQGLPVHTSYDGKRFSKGVRMLAFASQLLVWLRDNRPRRLLELGITGPLSWDESTIR